MRRKNTTLQLKLRSEIEDELASIEPLSPIARKLLSAQGFEEYFEMMKELYPSYKAAYERLETFYESITGKRRYSEYDSFRVCRNRQ